MKNTLNKRQIIALCEVAHRSGIQKGNKTLEDLYQRGLITYTWHIKNKFMCAITPEGEALVLAEDYGKITDDFVVLLSAAEYAVYLYDHEITQLVRKNGRKGHGTLTEWGKAIEPMLQAEKNAWEAEQAIRYYSKSYVECLLSQRSKFNKAKGRELVLLRGES